MKVSNYDQRCPPAFQKRGHACERCWRDSFFFDLAGADRVEEYGRLVKERKCTQEQQSGVFWNEELQIDERWLL